MGVICDRSLQASRDRLATFRPAMAGHGRLLWVFSAVPGLSEEMLG